MTAEEKPKPRRWLIWVAIALALSLYILAIGPINYLASKEIITEDDLFTKVLMVIYWPIVWLNVNEVEPFHGWMRAYCALWQGA